MAMNLDIPVLVIVRISTSILAYGSLPLILTVNANQLDLDKPSDPHWQEFQQKTGHAKAMDIGELPVGHMRPLGAHQAPEGHVEMLDVMPTPQELYEKYIRESKAVVLKNACNKYGATRKWDDIYLRKHFGHVMVKVDRHGKENRFEPSMRMNLSSFLEVYNETEYYLVDTLPREMWKDFAIPDCLLCGGFTERLQDVVMWISSGGSQSHLHMDTVDNINCIVSGFKKWFVVDQENTKRIIWDHDEADYSSVNVSQVDMHKYPFLQGLPWWNVSLEAGDCIYVPYGSAHQVTSTSRNVAVNIWWTPLKNFNYTDCNYKEGRDSNLDKYSFTPSEHFRFQLMQLLTRYSGTIKFKEMNENVLSEHTGRKLISLEDFKLIDKNHDEIVDETELEIIPRDVLEHIFDGLEVGTVTINGKYQTGRDSEGEKQKSRENDEL